MSKLKKPATTRALAVFCAKIAYDKIAQDILIMNLKKADSAPTDFFVLCTVASDTQMKAIIDTVLKTCAEIGIQKPRVEGYQSTQWVILDFFDVVFHIMNGNARNFYNIEKLWGDAQFLELTESGTAKVTDKKF